MKEHNDPTAVPENANDMTAGAAEGIASDMTQETRRIPKLSKDEAAPRFRVRKRQPDGTWKNHPVQVTYAAARRTPRRRQPKRPSIPPVFRRGWIPFRQGKKIRRGVVGAVAGVIIGTIVIFSIYLYQYSSIFPGVRVASNFSLTGMSQEEAQQYIENDCRESLWKKDITVTAEKKDFVLHVSDVADKVDSAASAQAAYAVGREGNYFQRAGQVLTAMFGGQNVSLRIAMKEDQLTSFVDGIYQDIQYDPVQPSWEVNKQDETLTVDTGSPGLDFDKDAVWRTLNEKITNLDFADYKIETYSVEQDKPDAKKIAKDVNCDPQNAKIDTKTGKTIDAVTGVEVTEQAISDEIGNGKKQTYTIPVTLTKADRSAADLEKVLFRDVLAQTTTTYNSGDSGRTTNVSLTAKACDGILLNPGDEFSYNTIVGERTPERGYQKATIFVSGESVEDYGGGACQSSSTIYMAVLRADLHVTERRNHQFQISYTPISQDATVAWGSQDFRFVNSTDYPIKISMEMGGGSLTCTIYGTKTDDKEVSLYSESHTSGNYKYATLYKTVTVNGKTETQVENESAYLLKEKN